MPDHQFDLSRVLAKTLSAATQHSAALASRLASLPGQPLDTQTRRFMERQGAPQVSRAASSSTGLIVGQPDDAREHEAAAAAESTALIRPQALADSSLARHDFSQVRVHTDARAAQFAHALHSAAFTVGADIFFAAGQYAPASTPGRQLLAHELTHVAQQHGAAAPMLQRRLIATGSAGDIGAFIRLVQPAIGLMLRHDPATNQIQAVGTLATPATSPALQSILTRIIDDPAQDAEVHFGRAQPRVAVGAFPIPPDLTGSREQQIDIDDVVAIEAGAPGNGLAKLAHEISENYTAHAAAPVAGVSRFPAAHAVGVASESRVATELVGPGNRVADVDVPVGTNIFNRVQDFENYYLVFTLTRNPATNDFSVSGAHRVPKVAISTHVVDHFVIDSDALPAAGAAAIAAAVAAVAANPSATVLIEGFTDSTGTVGHNLALSQRRARQAAAALVAAGVSGGRIHFVGRGETGFVAPNDVEANRARNRRIVITVTRPGP